MNAISLLFGIVLIAIVGISAMILLKKPKPVQTPKPQAQTMPVSMPSTINAPTKPEKKTYVTLMRDIQKDQAVQGKQDVEEAHKEKTIGKPAEFLDSMDKIHLEADKVFAVDEYGNPTKENVENAKVDIPLALQQHEQQIALLTAVAGMVLLFVILSEIG